MNIDRKEGAEKSTKYKAVLAVLLGSGVASVLVLLLNTPMSLPLSTLLFPGAMPIALLTKSDGFAHPLVVLAGNMFVYTTVAFAVFVIGCRKCSAARLRLAAIVLIIPVVPLISLACIPRFNPLWPRGMAELSDKKKEIQTSFPLGMDIERIRAVLNSMSIKVHERTETSERVVLKRGERIIVADAGDRTISSRIQTTASQFPCGYDIEIVLLFGQSNKLKEEYVETLRVCP